MHRYLLFDSGCTVCTGLADEIERESGGLLEARSLRDPEMHLLLEAARAPREWQPTLIEVDPRGTRVYTGVAMRVRLVRGLGVRRSGRILGLIVSQAIETSKAGPLDPTRRSLLKAAGLAVAATAIGFPVLASKAVAGSGDSAAGSRSPSESYGVKDYIVSQVGDRLEVQFRHQKAELSGVLTIAGIADPKTVVDLSRKSQVLGLELDREANRFTLDAGSGGRAIWTFSDGIASSSSGAEDLYAAHKTDFEIAAIVTSELTPKRAPTARSERTPNAEPGLVTAGCPCPGGSYVIRGYSSLTPYWWKSDACNAATSDVNVKCSNGYCWGCCYLWECDAICTLGDFLCTGSRLGSYCTGPCG